MINSKWIRGGCILAAFLMAAALFVEAQLVASLPLFSPPYDKLWHFFFYGTMATLLAHGGGRYWLIVPLILVPAIGAADEWHQSFVPGRSALAADWLADEAGTVVAVAIYWALKKREKRKEEREAAKR